MKHYKSPCMLGAVMTVSALGNIVAPHIVPDYQSQLSEDFKNKLELNRQAASIEAIEKARLKREAKAQRKANKVIS